MGSGFTKTLVSNTLAVKTFEAAVAKNGGLLFRSAPNLNYCEAVAGADDIGLQNVRSE